MARQVLIATLVTLAVAVAGCTSGDEASDTTTTTTVPAVPTTVATTTSTTQPTTTSTTTTTALPEPPHLEVLDPVHGATVTSARYTFSGVTDPGRTVTVGGKYEATVAEDGTWALDLMLGPGRNSTTFTATHPDTGLETAAQVAAVYAPLVLKADGLGLVSFGDPADETMSTLVPVLGVPDSDMTIHRTEVEAPPGGVCAGGYACWEYVRLVDWEDVGLSLVFSDLWWQPGDEWPYAQVPMSLVTYHTSNPAFRTPSGVGVGSTVADLQAAYGAALTVDVDFDFGPFFTVHLDEHDVPWAGSGYWGDLSENLELPTSVVMTVTAGAPSTW